MNDQAVYRTAPATQGLFNICDPSGQSFNQGRFFSQALLINTLQHCPFPGHTQGLLHGALDPGALCGGRGWMGSQQACGGGAGRGRLLHSSLLLLHSHLTSCWPHCRGQHLGLLQGPMSPPSTHQRALHLLLAGDLLKAVQLWTLEMAACPYSLRGPTVPL